MNHAKPVWKRIGVDGATVLELASRDGAALICHWPSPTVKWWDVKSETGSEKVDTNAVDYLIRLNLIRFWKLNPIEKTEMYYVLRPAGKRALAGYLEAVRDSIGVGN